MRRAIRRKSAAQFSRKSPTRLGRFRYGSVVSNLQTTVQWAQKNLSRPGCWAYPDMLEVGCQHGPGGAHDPGLTAAETRSHFGAWAIVSSPLTLSHDVNNEKITAAIWPVIANEEAIRVNQAWAGHSGSPFKEGAGRVRLSWRAPLGGRSHDAAAPIEAHALDAPKFQYFYKPIGKAEWAVLLMNHDDAPQDLALSFADVPGLSCTKCALSDVWAYGKSVGTFDTTYTAKAVGAHDAVFLTITPAAAVEAA